MTDELQPATVPVAPRWVTRKLSIAATIIVLAVLISIAASASFRAPESSQNVRVDVATTTALGTETVEDVPAPPPPEGGSDGYVPVFASDWQTLYIFKDKKVVGKVRAHDLDQYFGTQDRNDEYQGIAPEVVIYTYADWDEEMGRQIVEDMPYDRTRNAVYFSALDRATAGNVNANRGLFRYDFDTASVEEVGGIYGSGLTSVTLSPQDRYALYNAGEHGGACANRSWLEVRNLMTTELIAEIKAAGVPDGIAYLEFDTWLSPVSFRYTEYRQTIDECVAGSEMVGTSKTYVLGPLGL